MLRRTLAAIAVALLALLGQAGSGAAGLVGCPHLAAEGLIRSAGLAPDSGGSHGHHGGHAGGIPDLAHHPGCAPASSCGATLPFPAAAAVRADVRPAAWPAPAGRPFASRALERDPPIPRPFA